jgi:non-ribosomal peptide synthetase component F/thioesterase domain-containing protein
MDRQLMPADNEELLPKAEPMNLPVQDVSTEMSQKTEDVYLFPASLEQHRYWILDQVDQASTASNMAITFRLVGRLDDMLAEKSICALTLRHEALRTTFRMIDGDLNQFISETPLYHFAVTDLRTLTEDERAEQAEKVIREHSHVSMNLATGPLFFARLVHVTDEEHFLSCTMHHIVCDGWSNGILVRDFAEFYSAYSQDRSPNLAELPFQFADFTIWQKEWLASEAAEDALNFWREQIRRGIPAVDLPTDYPRSARKDGPGDIESQLMPQSLNERLKKFCREHEATNHQVLLAVFQGLISRYTGQEQFLLGSSIANRTQAGMDDVVGRFANPQVILADVSNDPDFNELLHRVVEWSTLAYAHQDLPFSRLMEEFQLDQSGATSQFLQIYFVYQKAFMQPQSAGELQIIPRPSVSGGVNFDLLVSIVERAEGPRLQIEYNTDLFERDRVSKFIQLYVRVLDAILSDPALKVSQLPLLSPDEELALYRAGRGPSLSRTFAPSLVEAFDRHADSLGATTAMIAGDERISWKSLADKSIQFANALRELNIEQGHIVALRMEPNSDAAAAALAILRVGAVVLPIPDSTSVAEWERMLAQLKPAAALAGSEFSSSLPSLTNFEKLSKSTHSHDDLPSVAAEFPAWCGLTINKANQYQTYTATHEQTASSLAAASQVLHLSSGDAVAIRPAPASTDGWIDLLLPLTNGASILYLPNTVGNQLQTILDREQISFVFATPGEWLTLLDSGWSGDRRLQMVCRGDRLPSTLTKRLLYAGHAWSLISSASAGGPISVTLLNKERPSENPAGALPGQGLTVLDSWGNPTPAGVVGELTLSSDEKSTRTGILAQHHLNDRFEVMDHVQNLVRLHGYRLRLGELEDRLVSHPGVTFAKAAIRNDSNHGPVLIAYIAGMNGTSPTASDVTQFLRASAPGHLACAELLSVDRIVVYPDGSPDMDALAKFSVPQLAQASNVDYVPPKDEIESRLVKIWEDVLSVNGIGVRTSFFSLGGYSLMIVRLFARINKSMNTSLPITTIFNAPTIEQLADILRGHRAYSSLVPVRTEGAKPPFFMILSYLLYGSLPDAIGTDYPFYGLRELDSEETMTPEERAASYVEAIRSIQPHGPYYLGGWCAAGPLTIEVGRQLMESGQQVGLVTLFDSWHPGYAESLKHEQKISGFSTLNAKLRLRYNYHREKMRDQTSANRLSYLRTAALNKLRSMRDAIYLKHWAATTSVFKTLGLPAPDFMQNLTQTTLMSLQQYEPHPFSGNIMLMRAMKAPNLPGADPTCGWNQVVKGNIDVQWVPGDHETMFLEPNLKVVGKTLREGLEKAHQGSETLIFQ